MLSEIGKGSQFHFTLAAKCSAKACEPFVDRDPEILRGAKTLIVDDNRTNRRILQAMLARWNMESETVPGGERSSGKTARGAHVRNAISPDSDGHAHAGDGRILLVEQIRRPPEIVNGDDDDADFLRTPGDTERCKNWESRHIY